MERIQHNKSTTQKLWQALDDDPAAAVPLLDHVTHWEGPAPVGPCTSGASIVADLFAPLKRAIPDLARHTHIFLGGRSEANENGVDGALWVAGTGYYTGHATGPAFGIPATGHDLRIRWGEFLRFNEAGDIVYAQTILDLVDWCDQIGHPILPKPRGELHVYPAPTGYDGRLSAPQNPETTEATLALGRRFIFGGLNAFDETSLSSMGMADFFHPKVKWYGPGGIGACLSLSEFETRHQQPWLTAFPDRKVLHLDSLFAEDRMLAASGPRGVIATHTGPYLGQPATGARLEVSGMDFWLRDGDRFVENWVFVDMVHLFAQMGVQLLDRLTDQRAIA